MTPPGCTVSMQLRRADAAPDASKAASKAFVLRVSRERLRIGGRIDGAVGANYSRELQCPVRDVGNDDLPRPCAPRHKHVERANRAAAGHQHAPAHEIAGLPHGMDANGERFRKRGRFEARSIANPVNLLFGADEGLSEGAANMRYAHGASIEAHVKALVLTAPRGNICRSCKAGSG
jgi:hypothetical protein